MKERVPSSIDPTGAPRPFDKVNITEGKTMLSVGTSQVSIKNVRELLPEVEDDELQDFLDAILNPPQEEPTE